MMALAHVGTSSGGKEKYNEIVSNILNLFTILLLKIMC